MSVWERDEEKVLRALEAPRVQRKIREICRVPEQPACGQRVYGSQYGAPQGSAYGAPAPIASAPQYPDLRGELESCQNRLAEEERKNVKLSDLVRQHENKHNELEGKCNQLDSRCRDLEGSCQELKNERQHLQNECRRLEGEVKGAERRLEQCQQEARVRREELEQQLNMLERQLNNLQKEKEDALKQLRSLQAQLQEAQREVERVKAVYGPPGEYLAKYRTLSAEIRTSLSDVICPRNEILFIASCATADHLKALWLCTKHALGNGGSKGDIAVLKEIFDYFFEVYNDSLSEPMYERDQVEEGDYFDEDDYDRAVGSSTSGRISEVVLRGYKSVNTGKPILRSLVRV